MRDNRFPELQRIFRQFPAYPAVSGFSGGFLRDMTCTVRSARIFECFPAWRMRPRRLSNDMLFFILRGEGRGSVDGRSCSLREGACLHARRGWLHEIRHDPKKPLRALVIHYTALIDFSLTLPEALGFPDLFDFRNDSFARDLLWQICRQYTLEPPAWQSSANATALAFLFHIVQQHSSAFHPAPAQRLSDLARITPVIRLMRESLASPLSIGDYAARVSLSTPQFRRVFQRATGMSPNKYLRGLRMEHAALLLRNTMSTIETISQQVGYREPAFFAKTFKLEMGSAPGAYRKARDLMDR